MKALLLFLSIIILEKNYAQQIKGIVVDSITGDKVQYATIYIKNTPTKGCYSNETGFFNIPCLFVDTVCIDALGYKKVFVTANKTIDTVITFKLIKDIKLLPDVIVKNKKVITSKKTVLGFHRNKKEIAYPGTMGGKITVLIPPIKDKGEYRISNIFFSIAKPIEWDDRKYNKGLVRVILFIADSVDGDFGRNLLSEDIIVTVAKRRHSLKVDVSKYRIAFPKNGVYLGLEWLGEKNSDSIIVKDNIGPFYYRSASKEFKTQESFFGKAFYDPYLKKENTERPKKYVPNFGMEVIKVE